MPRTWTLIALLSPLLILQLLLMAVALWDMAHRAGVRYLPKWGWVLIVLLVNFLGPIAYLLMGREE